MASKVSTLSFVGEQEFLIPTGKGLAWIGRPQAAMHSQLPRYLVLLYFVVSLRIVKLLS